jgi:hypothetical protein
MAATTVDSDLIKFDQFVTIGSPPSQNPTMYTKKIAKFILDSRLRFPDAILLTCVGSFYEVEQFTFHGTIYSSSSKTILLSG